MAKYPAIEFLDGPVGRRPGLRVGPETGQALAYAAEHRDEVDAWVDEHDRLGEEMEREYVARPRA